MNTCPKCGKEYGKVNSNYLREPVEHCMNHVECLRNQLAQRDAEIERLRAIIAKDWRAECDRFYDDPRNAGHPLPINPIEAAKAENK